MDKKIIERQILNFYLQAKRISLTDDFIEPTERPDFLLQLADQQIGVEVTQYHMEGNRRQIEEEWKAFREDALKRPDFPDFRTVKLHFIQMRIPPTSEKEGFTNEVFQFVNENAAVEDHQPDAAKYPLLAKHLSRITVSPTRACKVSWFWNYDSAWVGVQEHEIIRYLRRKTKALAIPADMYWLLIFGGNEISNIIPNAYPEQLQLMPELEAVAAASPFDRVVLLGHKSAEWQRGEGWRSL